MNLKGRNFLKLLDFTPEEIQYLLDLAADFKRQKKNGQRHDDFYGKNIALIFEKTSTRTRCSFEVAAHDLGMNATYLAPLARRLARKNPSQIPLGFWGGCLTGLSIAALDRQL